MLFSRKYEIYEAVWKLPGDECGSAVTNVISQLRRKIGDGYIETVVGSGYRFGAWENKSRGDYFVLEWLTSAFLTAWCLC